LHSEINWGGCWNYTQHVALNFTAKLFISTSSCAVAEWPCNASGLSGYLQQYNTLSAVFDYYIAASDLRLHTIKLCSVVFGIYRDFRRFLAFLIKSQPFFMKLGKMTDTDKAMNPHLGSDSSDVRIDINREIQIWLPEHLCLTFWPWESLRSPRTSCCLVCTAQCGGALSC